MAYGVTPTGLIRPRLPELRQELVEDLRARLRAKGLPDNIETRPDSVAGLMIDTFADREAALWEMGEGVYYSMYPGSAYGTALDRAVSFTGVERRSAERSKAVVVAYGVIGTIIRRGSQIRHKATQSIWETTADVTITPQAAVDVSISPTPAPSTTYTVTIDGNDYSYTSGVTASLNTVLAGLVGALSVSGLSVSSDGATVRVTMLTSMAMDITLTSNMVFTRAGSAVIAQTMQAIPEAAEIGDLDTIVTMTDGWAAVTNLQTGSVGRMQETDAELRARYASGLFRLGAGTLPSIAVNIRDRVQGVSAIKVIENDTDSLDAQGNKPHSIRVVVEGGIETEIADALYRVKGAGIDTNGAVSTTLDTDEGLQTILFDRPEYIYVWVKAVITLLPPSEEPFPSNGFDLIQDAITKTGQALDIGNDVVLQRFNGPIYKSTDGLAHVGLTIAYSTDPGFSPAPGDYTSDNITVEEYQMARFDRSRVEVT